MVETHSETCKSLRAIYGKTASRIIKQIISTATEKIQCARLKVFIGITPDKDPNLIVSCKSVYYLGYCETLNQMFPLRAGTTVNLLN